MQPASPVDWCLDRLHDDPNLSHSINSRVYSAGKCGLRALMWGSNGLKILSLLAMLAGDACMGAPDASGKALPPESRDAALWECLQPVP
jgi:hypothetical protein